MRFAARNEAKLICLANLCNRIIWRLFAGLPIRVVREAVFQTYSVFAV